VCVCLCVFVLGLVFGVCVLCCFGGRHVCQHVLSLICCLHPHADINDKHDGGKHAHACYDSLPQCARTEATIGVLDGGE